jgi:ubiquinone/menaquinone biosynthesis C-methylase UbiE
MYTNKLAKINSINELGYSLIAEPLAKGILRTTANFHDIGFDFFYNSILRREYLTDIALDIGTGTGYLLPILQKRFKVVVALDISSTMLSLIQQDRVNKIQASAFNLPFKDSSVDTVTTSLGDPFFIIDALREINRVLISGGMFTFSLPYPTWSDKIRKNMGIARTTTRLANSQNINSIVYSFTYDDDDLRMLLSSCGFKISKFEVIKGQEIFRFNHELSPTLKLAAEIMGIEIEDLPIIQMVESLKA